MKRRNLLKLFASVVSASIIATRKVSSKLPEEWREKILRLFPHKDAPLLHLLRDAKPAGADIVHRAWWKDNIK